jgi:hypothetical protein
MEEERDGTSELVDVLDEQIQLSNWKLGGLDPHFPICPLSTIAAANQKPRLFKLQKQGGETPLRDATRMLSSLAVQMQHSPNGWLPPKATATASITPLPSLEVLARKTAAAYTGLA